MAAYCIITITIITLYLSQFSSVMTAPTERKNAYEDSIEEAKDITETNNDNEQHDNHHHHHHHHHHTQSKTRTKRLAVNTCGGKLVGPVQILTIASHRQTAMNLLKQVMIASKIHLITENIDVSNFHEYRLHASNYDYLKPIEETDEPKLSEWHHKMQLYLHTFTHLRDHQQKNRKNLDLIKELEELILASEKILCEIQSIALHLEEKPNLRWITGEEKKNIENNLRTNVRHQHVDEIDLVYSKVFHFDNVNGMTKSLMKCMQDCSCVGGYGECKSVN